jgi:hypothetical protein
VHFSRFCEDAEIVLFPHLTLGPQSKRLSHSRSTPIVNNELQLKSTIAQSSWQSFQLKSDSMAIIFTTQSFDGISIKQYDRCRLLPL